MDPQTDDEKEIQKRGRGWCFTINNPPSYIDNVLEYVHEDTAASYTVAQMETGEKGTDHLQGYIHFSNKKSFAFVKSLFPEAHWERARGTPVQNKAYCTKSETRIRGPFEFGEVPRQGRRTDLDAIQDDLDSGKTLASISRKYFGQFIRYHRGFREYQLLTSTSRKWEMEVLCYVGPSGVGKSRTVFERFPDAYWKSKNSGQQQFWDGYMGHSVIIIDEFYGWLPFDYLLRLTDRYPFSLDCKHGTLPLSARTICFTSNKHPSEWYNWIRLGVPEWDTMQSNGVPCNPLQRRISRIYTLGLGTDAALPVDVGDSDRRPGSSPPRLTRVTEPGNLFDH